MKDNLSTSEKLAKKELDRLEENSDQIRKLKEEIEKARKRGLKSLDRLIKFRKTLEWNV